MSYRRFCQSVYCFVRRRQVSYRPLSTDEVKVVLLELGFEEPEDRADRTERVLVARKPLG